MVELPTHSDGGEASGEAMHRGLSKRARLTIVIGAVLAVVLAIVLHLAGVFGG